MLCTVIWDTYRADERREVWTALRCLLSEHSPHWSRKGVYAYWDPKSRQLLYVGLATNLPERFALHNELIAHSGGNKADRINDWFIQHERLGFTILIQAAAVEILDVLYQLSPSLGAESKEITRVAEGQLIELHRMEYGHRPPWNGVGGSTQGAQWATPSGRSIIRLLSAADSSLFVARRTLRQLALDPRAQRLEAIVHAARMQALMESHLLEDYNVSQEELVDRITHFLMLREGKLVDDLDRTDQQIRQWVERFADYAFLVANQEKMLHRMDEITSKEKVLTPDEHVANEFIRDLLFIGIDEETTETALEVLEIGYLEEAPHLPL